MKWERLTHDLGKRASEPRNLCLNVGEEDIRGPAAHFLNGTGRDALKVQGHGAAGAKGVAADSGWYKAMIGKVASHNS